MGENEGKGIKEEWNETVWDMEKGKTVSWKITSLDTRVECVWSSNNL